MHQLLTQFTVRWLSLMTGAAHATTALRAMTRHAPESDPDDEVPRERAGQLAPLLTPIIKAFFTEQGFRQASNALQVFGGYGYVAEFAIEQTLRDSRIAMIYEGSNEIQANDLLLRKVLGDDGRAFGLLLAALRTEAGQGGEYAECAGFARALGSLCDTLADVVEAIRERTRHDSEYPYRAAPDFLQLCGVTLLAMAWARAARVSRALPDDDPLRAAKLQSAGFFFDYLPSRLAQHLGAIDAARAALAFV